MLTQEQIMRALVFIGALMVVGCTTPEAPTKPTPAAMPEMTNPKEFNDADRDACAAEGGNYEMAGRLGWMRCTQSFEDAGKVCTDSSDCMGKCLTDKEIEFDEETGPKATTGTCAANDNPFGCYTMVNDGIPSTICVD